MLLLNLLLMSELPLFLCNAHGTYALLQQSGVGLGRMPQKVAETVHSDSYEP